jgi:ActR/RegA family two-component response regulator
LRGVSQYAGNALSATELDPDLAIIDLTLADRDTGGAVAQTLQSLGIRAVILSGHTNIGTGLVPRTFAAKPVSKEVVMHLLRAA